MGLGDMWRVWKLHTWILGGGVSEMNWAKLGSRKFLIALFSLIVLFAFREAEADPQIVEAVKWILVSYLGAQGIADFGKAKNGGA